MKQFSKMMSERLGMEAAGGEHPDPDLLTGFVEHCLPQGEHDAVMVHLGQCCDCRAVVLLATAEAEPTAVTIPRRQATARPLLRWAAVASLAGIVVAGALLFLPVRQEESTAYLARSASSVPAGSTQAGMMPQNPASGNAAETQAAPTPGFAASGAMARMKLPAPAAKQKQQPATAEASRGEAGGGAAAQAKLSRAPVQWRLSDNGTILRSADSGRSWTAAPVNNAVTFLALAVVAGEVWAGGRRGALYHSADAGAHWEALHPASHGTAVEDDIVRLGFADAQHGSLTCAAGEVLITADGGHTWRNR